MHDDLVARLPPEGVARLRHGNPTSRREPDTEALLTWHAAGHAAHPDATRRTKTQLHLSEWSGVATARRAWYRQRQVREYKMEMAMAARAVQISGQRFDLDTRRIVRAVSRALPEPVRDHYVVIEGRRYPPKQVIALATGLDRADFTTHQARRILRRLGFTAARRTAFPAPPSTPATRRPAADPVERLRPHIGEWVAIKDDDVLVSADSPTTVLAWLSQHDQTADSMFRVPENETAAGGAAPA